MVVWEGHAKVFQSTVCLDWDLVVSQSEGYFLGVPIIRTIIFCGLLGVSHFGKLPFEERTL